MLKRRLVRSQRLIGGYRAQPLWGIQVGSIGSTGEPNRWLTRGRVGTFCPQYNRKVKTKPIIAIKSKIPAETSIVSGYIMS